MLLTLAISCLWVDDADLARRLDGDGDGYADAALEGDDCDDGDPDVHPGAPDACDGRDDDCDGTPDDDDPPSTWYADGDGDGHGDPAATAVACEAPAGFVADDGDCDDAHATAHPGAIDVIGDWVDNRCEGGDHWLAKDAGVPVYAQLGSPTELTAALRQRQAGAALAVGDVSGDGFADLLVGAPGSWKDDADITANHGSAALFLGPFPGSRGRSSAELVIVSTERSARLGGAVAIGDLDGDGVGELVVGADSASGRGGAVYVFQGPVAGGARTAAGASVTVRGTTGLLLGDALAVCEDFDGAGRPALLAAALLGGSVWMYAWPRAGDVAHDEADAHIDDEDEDLGNAALAADGDFDGDGVPDLVVGDPRQDGFVGAVYLVRGPLKFAGGLADAEARWLGGAGTGNGSPGHAIGWSVALGDLDGDGLDDVVVGAGLTPTTWVDLAPAAGTHPIGDADVRLAGTTGDDGSTQVLVPGDLDGDGASDLAIGDLHRSSGRGQMLLARGHLSSGVYSYDDLDASRAGGSVGGSLGAALAAGDLTGDGVPDVVAGAPGEYDEGVAWVFPGVWP